MGVGVVEERVQLHSGGKKESPWCGGGLRFLAAIREENLKTSGPVVWPLSLFLWSLFRSPKLFSAGMFWKNFRKKFLDLFS